MAFDGAFGKVQHLRKIPKTTILKIEERDYVSLHLRQPFYKLLHLHLLHPGLPIGRSGLTVVDRMVLR